VICHCLIVGGGIVGLATGLELLRQQAGLKVLLIEKESRLAAHQTGRNSGVIHAGVYYKPGSLKARMAVEGNRSMVAFCREQGVPHEVCGKVIVATEPEEMPLLERLFERGQQNGLELHRLNTDQVRELEPHARCLAGVRVPSTGIVSYGTVCDKLAELFRTCGGEIRTGARVTGIRRTQAGYVVETPVGAFEGKFLVTCAGLHSDRIARLAGESLVARIVPFRGEYYELAPQRRSLVRGLIYPVPNPKFPFLGVHLTRMIDGSVHAGPNAVLAFKREGYCWTDVNIRDLWDSLTFPGFWRLALRNLGEGLREIHRSLSKQAFLRSLQRLVPDLQLADLRPAHAGVRAQALWPNGGLVDDFLLVRGERSVHVCNAPSPAATAALEIGKFIAAELPPLN
jgi:(S)-2-hydroxyglutarate dehydrogenase